VAIEPFPANFDSLVKNIQTNKLGDRIVPLSIGLGRETAIVPFNWASGEPGGSLHSFGEIVVLSHGEQKRPIGYHWCLSYRLDDLVALPGVHFPTHIKIDVDGSEIDVLDGGRKVLADPRCRAIQVEVVDPDISRSRSAEVCELMAQAGMTLAAEHAHSTSYPLVTDLQFIKR
jgi:FkbM family methyltransferase